MQPIRHFDAPRLENVRYEGIQLKPGVELLFSTELVEPLADAVMVRAILYHEEIGEVSIEFDRGFPLESIPEGSIDVNALLESVRDPEDLWATMGIVVAELLQPLVEMVLVLGMDGESIHATLYIGTENKFTAFADVEMVDWRAFLDTIPASS